MCWWWRCRCATGPMLVQLFLVLLALCSCSAEVLTPPYFNLAEGRKITATATCGDEGKELYCKLVGANSQNEDTEYVIQGQACDTCDMNSPTKNHPPDFAVDGMETWWQSPPLSRGMKYNEVNLTIDLGQEFHVAYVFVRMAISPRPEIWALEKSTDYGKSYTPWQYFADSLSDCEVYFGKESLLPITKDDSVICNREYSKIVPLEGGEIPISLLKHRPSANMYFNSSVLQEWTRATNVRLRLLRTKTLLGNLMSPNRQDPTVTRRYFYSIKDISIGGRCMCNGHALTCDIPDPVDLNKLQCRCQHNTCGSQCEMCCPGFEQKAWRQSQQWQKFVCEPCNCFNHSNECDYDVNIDAKRLSLDIHGKYEGGGVCKNCQHNTEGINCNKCKATFYKPYSKQWDELDACQPCDCDYYYSTGNCAEGSGTCECRKEYQSPLCDSCSYGYFGYPKCIPCTCNLNGTDGDFCEPEGDKCPCKYNYNGIYCEQCTEGYYNFPKCEECNCNKDGAIMTSCDQQSGNCTCKNNFAGRTCDRCEAGFYDYPACKYCSCDSTGTIPTICDIETGVCQCKEGFGGPRCDQCLPGYYPQIRDKQRNCVKCDCSFNGSTSETCDLLGKCTCFYNFAGNQCDQCHPGYYKYPDCLPCNCDTNGAIGKTCDDEGQCQCRENFDNFQCSVCKETYYNYPLCEECNCDPNGVIESFAGCGSVPVGELCECKQRVQGRICDQCKPLYWNLQKNNELGCQECQCNKAGSQSGVSICDTKTGQCLCKYNVIDQQCNSCKDGTYNLTVSNIFGCTDCGCDIGGSVDNICNKETGQCSCKPRITGLQCNEPITAHYFPTLHQYQYEVEDGLTPSNNPVRSGFSQQEFPNFSWKGYAVFSLLQNEIRQDVQIFESYVYQMVLRYVKLHPDPIVGKILITPENPSETEQSFDVLFKQSLEPRFVTVSGILGNTPSPFVMSLGTWHVTIKTDKSLYVDYFVLIPSAYYEASILSQQVINPCLVGYDGLCRHFGYPVLEFDKVLGSGGYFLEEKERSNNDQYIDNEQSNILELPMIPLINDNLNEFRLDYTVPHPGKNILLIEYVTPIEKRDQGNGYITMTVKDSKSQDSSKIYLYSCPYTTPCRQVLLDEKGRIKAFQIDDNFAEITLKSEPGSSVGLVSITVIPYDQWNLDFIKPQSVCVKKNGKCTESEFPIIPDSKKVEFEVGSEPEVRHKPPNVFNNATELLYLEDDIANVEFKVPNSGQYVFIVQYYQPRYPETKLAVIMHNGQFYEGYLSIKHCPSVSGCRSVVQSEDGSDRFSLNENFDLKLKGIPKKGVWLDYLLVVPANQFSNSLLEENRLDQTHEFISACGNDNFHINTTDEGFCRNSVFSLTSDYNNGAIPCNCDYYGSLSFECNKFGGQCECKPNIIGRRCEACKTGFYGFPNCQPCNCPSKAPCEKDTGECICPTRVVGEKCDQCMPYTYGFDIVNGCEDCNCHPLGVLEDQLQCDLLNGSCICKENIVGRTCDQCIPGYYAFPDCFPCDCNIRGSIADICDKNSAECFCKANVGGLACDECNEGTFNLREDNDAGCTKCFCFGKITRCNSANLYWDQIAVMEHWRLFDIVITNNVTLNKYKDEPKFVNSTVIKAEVPKDISHKVALYFSAPEEYLGNKLNTYGGNLNYTITNMKLGKANTVNYADVLLLGGDVWLLHTSIEQPPINTSWSKSLDIVEKEFVTLNNLPATRALLMTVLENLQGIYIRGSYWESNIIARLQDVSLDIGVEIWNKDSLPANTIEKCECPVNYKGNSCEDCADGYYRISSGPHGGFCVPCQCNNHADKCDVETGICIDCKHNTYGDHCEKCIVGYHGNATQQSPNDCLICACPLPQTSNNFATGCEFSPEGDKISCDCIDNYTGAQCEYCAPGFYGRPRDTGDYCKQCQCSGNINVDDPAACDTQTGECLKCMNNTYGEACNLCRPGFFGDAIFLKDCQVCMCDKIGMERCDSYTGTCVCKPGVTGEKCDRCEDDHWGFESGNGCTACNCSVASNSTQCSDINGQCKCKSGVTGKQCNKCAPGFWNFSSEGCITCGCNTGYSLGFGCNANTGHCECLPGVIGDKCDHCPYRNVLIPDEGCFKCDSCVHDLLNSTDDLQRLIDPVMTDFENKASGYFTHQRLVYIAEKADSQSKALNKLMPNTNDLSHLSNKLKEIDETVETLDREVNYNLKELAKVNSSSSEIVEMCNALEKDIKKGTKTSKDTVEKIDLLALNLEVGEGPKIDNALAEARQILSDLQATNLSSYLQASDLHADDAELLRQKIGEFVKPIFDQAKSYEDLHGNLTDINEKLKDLLNIYEMSIEKSNDAESLNNKNGEVNIDEKMNSIKLEKENVGKELDIARDLLKNATNSFNYVRDEIEGIGEKSNNAHNINFLVNQTLHSRDMIDLKNLADDAKVHKEGLVQTSDNLIKLLENEKSNPETEIVVKAVSSYSDIVKEITNATDTADKADTDDKSYLLLEEKGFENSASEYKNKGISLYETAENVLKSVPDIDLVDERLSESKTKIKNLSKVFNETKAQFDQKIDRLSNTSESIGEILKHLDDKQNATIEYVNKSQKIIKDAEKALQNMKNSSASLYDLPSIDGVKQTLNTNDREVSNTLSLVDNVEKQIENFTSIMTPLKRYKDNLAKEIAAAKNKANQINIGVNFDEKTTLELPLPSNVDDMETINHVSGSFRTHQENGFLMYLGNLNGTKLRRTRRDDFMALEIENGYLVLTIDVGNGLERINSKKFISDNNWYKFSIDKAGKNVKLTVEEDNDDQRTPPSTISHTLSGPNTILNLNKDQSKLYIGGYPNNVAVQDVLRFSIFEGQIQNLVIGDTPVGLWNFKEVQGNITGAKNNDKTEKERTGYRFNGDGYVILDARPYSMKERFFIEFSFKTSSEEGLFFLAGKGKSFQSIEMRNGRIFFQFRLSGDVLTIGSLDRFDDGKWHILRATRDQKTGLLEIDNKKINKNEANGQQVFLDVTDHLYIGGYPNRHDYIEVTNTGFNGCIDNVTISRNFVNLAVNVKTYGVKPGCPEKISTLVVIGENEGFVKKTNISISNDFMLSMKFKTTSEDGLLFYATDKQQVNGISLSLSRGVIVAKSQRIVLSTGSNTYNDDQWHVVTVIHDSKALSIIIDDFDQFSTDDAPPMLHIMYGDLYIGGLPMLYEVQPSNGPVTEKIFSGCLGEAVMNGMIVDFSNAVDKYNNQLQDCSGKIAQTHYNVPLIQDYEESQETPEKARKPQPRPKLPIIAEETETEREPTTTTVITERTTVTTVSTSVRTTLKPETPEIPINVPRNYCDLEYNVDLSSKVYRFGTRNNSHIRYSTLADKYLNNFEFSVEFKTDDFNGGLIFYAADKVHKDFVALYMEKSKVYFAIYCGTATVRLESKKSYNDDQWHSIKFKKNQNTSLLFVDNSLTAKGEVQCATKSSVLEGPFYYGGLENATSDIMFNLKDFYSPFNGCLKNLLVSNTPMEETQYIMNVLPCTDQVEPGYFFGSGGGYLRLKEKFMVGTEFSISMEIKPRGHSGLLVGVHGRKDYLLLEIVNSTVILRVSSGGHPYEALYKLVDKSLLCDGLWHSIHAIKSKNMALIGVDTQFSDPSVGGEYFLTNTTSALFIGGHRKVKHVRGAVVTNGFFGCIRNVKINNKPVKVPASSAHGHSYVGMCPTD